MKKRIGESRLTGISCEPNVRINTIETIERPFRIKFEMLNV